LIYRVPASASHCGRHVKMIVIIPQPKINISSSLFLCIMYVDVFLHTRGPQSENKRRSEVGRQGAGRVVPRLQYLVTLGHGVISSREETSQTDPWQLFKVGMDGWVGCLEVCHPSRCVPNMWDRTQVLTSREKNKKNTHRLTIC